MNVDVLFSVDLVHKATGRRYQFGVKASDVRNAVDKIFHPTGIDCVSFIKPRDIEPLGINPLKLKRDNFHVLKVVQREG